MTEPPSVSCQPPAVQRILLAALPLLVLWLGFWLRLDNAWREFEVRVPTTMPDDAYYYFGIARHLALGHVPSIDGVNATNGYHPLWLLVLVPIFYLLRNAADLETPVHVVLTVGALLDVLAGVMLWRVLRRLDVSYGARLVALVYFLGNAYQVVNATCGMETSLALVLTLALVLSYLRARMAVSARSVPWLFGVAAGLAILARTDLVVVVGVLLAAVVWRARGVSTACALRWLRIVLGVSLTLLLPWAIYSYSTVGTVVQSSGAALTIVYERLPEAWGIGRGAAIRLAQAGGAMVEGYHLVQRFVGLSLVGLPALVVAVGLWAVVDRRSALARIHRQWAALVPFVVAVGILFGVHTAGRLVFREWYTGPFVLLAALLVGVVTDGAAVRLGLRWIPAVAVGLLAWPLWTGHVAWRSRGVYQPPGLPRPPSASRFSEAHTDCGIGSYFATYGLTNLDGIVNQQALEALQQGRLLDYVAAQDFRLFSVTPYLHASVFMGPRYRERVRFVDETALRVVESEADKSLGRLPRPKSVLLGDVAGREFLGDGWVWARSGEPVHSVGPASELIVYVPWPRSGWQVELEARAVAVDEAGVQPVDVWVDGNRVASFRLTAQWSRVRVPLPRASFGTTRVVLRYGAPWPVREQGRGWYRSQRGQLLSAIEAARLDYPTLSLPVGPAGESPCQDVDIARATFVLCARARTWHEAAERCRRLGGELASAGDEVVRTPLGLATQTLSQGPWWFGASGSSALPSARGATCPAGRFRAGEFVAALDDCDTPLPYACRVER